MENKDEIIIKINDTKNNQPTTMDEFAKTTNLITKFVHFIQSLDKWIYEVPSIKDSRPLPITPDEVNDIAVDFAKHMKDNYMK